MDLVSVIIPCYNMEKLVEKSVRSVLNQTYKNVEVISIDDGSTDSTGIILDSLAREDSRVKVFHQKNGGIGVATNKALDNAQGNYITPLDSDDYFAPEMIERLLKALHDYDAEIAQCDRYRFYDINGLDFTPQKDTFSVYTREEILNEYFHDGITNLNWGARIYKREIIGNIRCPEGHQFVDVILAPQLLSRCKKYVYTTGKYYYNYLAPSSISRRIFTDSRWNDCKYANEFYELFVKNECPEQKNYLLYRRVDGTLNTYIAVHRSDKVSDKKRKLETLRMDFMDNYKQYLETDYYKNSKLLRKIQITLFKLSPKIFIFIYGDCSGFIKYRLFVPVRKKIQTITK